VHRIYLARNTGLYQDIARKEIGRQFELKAKKVLNSRPTVDFPRRNMFYEKGGSRRYLTLATLDLPNTSFLKHETQLLAMQIAVTGTRQS